MHKSLRWDPCVAHHDAEAIAFIHEYFAQPDRSVLLVCGSGFDPRSTVVAGHLAVTGVKRRGIFIRENRANPAAHLLDNATQNLGLLTTHFPDHEVLWVEIFGGDGATVGGRNAANAIKKQKLTGWTDIVVDISALSLGVAFPIIKFLAATVDANLHILITHDPELDNSISANKSDSPTFIHGFRGRFSTDEISRAAKLWLPQLCRGRRPALNRIFEFIEPHDTCPILPFPARNPRAGDELVEHFIQEIESGWSVDTRNIVYASEGDPLDLYRTILRLEDLRVPVFAECDGSLLVLSPLGSKVMALGCMMAALERDLPIVYLEAVGYEVEPKKLAQKGDYKLVHLWLEGDVYPTPRSSTTGSAHPP